MRDLAQHQHGFGRARRCLDAGDGDGGAARLRQRNRGPLEPLALAPGLIAGRDDLGAGWNAFATAANETLTIAKAAATARTHATMRPTLDERTEILR